MRISVLLGSVVLWLISFGEIEASSAKYTILVSFSIPKRSLQQWSQVAHKINAPLVLRGLPQNSFKALQRELLKIDPHGQARWQIDPRLFKKWGIQRVPTVVRRQDGRVTILSGNVSWAYMVSRFQGLK